MPCEKCFEEFKQQEVTNYQRLVEQENKSYHQYLALIEENKRWLEDFLNKTKTP